MKRENLVVGEKYLVKGSLGAYKHNVGKVAVFTDYQDYWDIPVRIEVDGVYDYCFPQDLRRIKKPDVVLTLDDIKEGMIVTMKSRKKLMSLPNPPDEEQIEQQSGCNLIVQYIGDWSHTEERVVIRREDEEYIGQNCAHPSWLKIVKK